MSKEKAFLKDLRMIMEKHDVSFNLYGDEAELSFDILGSSSYIDIARTNYTYRAVIDLEVITKLIDGDEL